MSNTAFFDRAIALAQKATNPSPNPRVGAVVVKNGKIIAEGFHARAGEPHAEPIALKKAGVCAADAELFVTLEPCRHHGKTPPCTDAILKSGVQNVWIGMTDPSTKAGGGANVLRKAGVKVQFAGKQIEQQCRDMNQIWLKSLTSDIPYLTLKLALDETGSTIPPPRKKWITGTQSRKKVHEMRAQHDAILVGVGTVVADDPQLTVRGVKIEKQPIRIILDPHGRMPKAARLLKEPGETIVVTRTTQKIPGAKNLVVPQFQLKTMLKKLRERNITNIFVEGGATTAQHFMKEELIDRVEIFIGGGKLKKWPIWLQRKTWKHTQKKQFGQDLYVHGSLHRY